MIHYTPAHRVVSPCCAVLTAVSVILTPGVNSAAAVDQAMNQAMEQAMEHDCRCRSPDGKLQELGTVQCFNIVGTDQLLRCEMSTNTPYWKKVDGVKGCPDA